MKKVYLQPSICVDSIQYELSLLTASTQGNAGEQHGGGASGEDDKEEEKDMGGTGGDSGFTMGSKKRGFFE